VRHPSGQLALLNPPAAPDREAPATPLHPLLLPFAALDSDDRNKVQQAIEMSGCEVQYGDYGSVCIAIGDSPWAGGYLYAAGSFVSGELVEHPRGGRDIGLAHRVRIGVDLRERHYRWIAPYESSAPVDGRGQRGRLTGFAEDGSNPAATLPAKDFGGWIWQPAQCLDRPQDGPGCRRRSFFSVRLSIAALQEDLFAKRTPPWPPADLNRILVHLEVLAPGDGKPVLDSNSADAAPPFSLNDLAPLLLPGESLRIRRIGNTAAGDIITLDGLESAEKPELRWLGWLVRRLSSGSDIAPITASETIATPLAGYEMTLSGDARVVHRGLGSVATHIAWFVAAMLLAILLAWLAIEAGIVSRITVLTHRAASVSKTVKAANGLADFDLGDLRGADELGVLATCLSDLLRRVQEDVEREHIRAEQEKDMWHAVGHEIMSPLQSLLALHPRDDDPSTRYIKRMQQAVRVLYDNASPSEAIRATAFQVCAIDIDRFLGNIAVNAPRAGIELVEFTSEREPVMVRADEYSLEDVVTHILHNAQRYRTPGTPITIRLQASGSLVTVSIHNHGPPIADGLIDKIFEYGVSDLQDADGSGGHRGQGLFVAKTYVAKMGGTIAVQNLAGGVSFVLHLPRARDAANA
jgi:signal transduction histidine kinase